MTFTRMPDGRLQVSKIVPGGDAERKKVIVGSGVVAVGERKLSQFNSLIAQSKSMPKPVKFCFLSGSLVLLAVVGTWTSHLQFF